MARTIAVAFIHGIGRTVPGYSNRMRRNLEQRFAKRVRNLVDDPAAQLVFEEVNWSAALQADEVRLWKRLHKADSLRFSALRHFMLDFAADAIAYQPNHTDRSAYDAIHEQVAEAFARLAARAGDRAPLCVIAHSLGSVVASNYLYDLSRPRSPFLAPCVGAKVGDTPLERGETLALLYTMGSPIALWSLRYPGFGVPLRFPPRRLARHHPRIEPEWVNFYDPDDVIAYPLKPLNPRYDWAVTEDRAVGVGWLLTAWNPLSHLGYWRSRKIADEIADGLVRAWRGSSALSLVPARRRRLARVRRMRANG